MMYLQFNLSGLPVSPAYAGYMKFHFIDLDLQGVNDPGGFNESIEINFTPDGGTSWGAPHGTTTAITDSVSNYQVAGDYYYQSITVSDIVLNSQNPLLARLDFATRSDFTGTNTKEWLKAELCLQPVPLPAAIYLLGTGFMGLAGLRRKIKR